MVPKAVDCVEPDIDDLLNFLAEPKELAPTLRTTNAIERSFREVRRRTNPMSCFNNEASCERIIYAVFTYQNSKWKGLPRGARPEGTPAPPIYTEDLTLPLLHAAWGL